MGNGLFAVDGIDIAALVAEHIGPRMLPCVLYKAQPIPERDPDNPTAVPTAPDPVALKAQGFIVDFDPKEIDGTLIKTGDRKVTLIAGTIEGGAVPDGGDSVLIEGVRYHVHKVLSRDAAAATYVLQARNM